MKKAILTALACSLVALPAYAAKDKHQGMRKDKIEHTINKMDSDRDGRISMNEHEAFSARMFSKIDANNDQTLTHQELASYQHGKMGKEGYKDKYGYNE